MFTSSTHSMVICTPTKTGSQSLRSLLVKKLGFEDVKPNHRADWDGPEKRRVLMVRNPYKRLESMYKMALRRTTATTGYKPDVHGDTFLDFLKHHQTVEHTDWSLNYSDYQDIFRPTEIWDLENINRIIAREFPGTILPHNNNAQKLYDCQIIWGEKELEVAAPFVAKDLMRFGYVL